MSGITPGTFDYWWFKWMKGHGCEAGREDEAKALARFFWDHATAERAADVERRLSDLEAHNRPIGGS